MTWFLNFYAKFIKLYFELPSVSPPLLFYYQSAFFFNLRNFQIGETFRIYDFES